MKKVKVSEGLSEQDKKDILAHTKGRILQHVQSNAKRSKMFRELSRSKALEPLNIAPRFWEFRHVCLNCGDVQDMSAYAIAQLAMNNAIKYTCECGHITHLPQR